MVPFQCSKLIKKNVICSVNTDTETIRKSPSEFLHNAAQALNAGKPQQAVTILKNNAESAPLTAYSAIGAIYLSTNEPQKALDWLNKARQCELISIDVIIDIIKALIKINDIEQACNEVQNNFDLLIKNQNLTALFRQLLEINASDEIFRLTLLVLDKNPDKAEKTLSSLTTAFQITKQLELLHEWFKKIEDQRPSATVFYEIARVCYFMGRITKSAEYLQKAATAIPPYSNQSELFSSLGHILIWQRKNYDAINMLKRSVILNPQNPATYSNLLFNLHYQDTIDQNELHSEHAHWAKIHAPLQNVTTRYANDMDPERALRIGYISPDFKDHPVPFFIEPILDAHDRSNVEVFAFSSVVSPDQITQRLKPKFDHFRDISGVSDSGVSEMIRKDKIDILIDLAGHTKGNRLKVLAAKPAPVAVTYLGYPDTTGIDTIDYRLTDSITDSQTSQPFYSEKLVFLPNSFLCYAPCDFAPPLQPTPALKNNYITFGSFNNCRKINPNIANIWANVLKANDHSRLLLKFNGGDDPQLKKTFLDMFAGFGIESDRIQITGLKNSLEHLSLYNQVDIALDTFPYNGTTTTCEALWMGVPVLTLTGGHHISRVGLSILTSLGLEFFAAPDPDQFVKKAAALASNLDALTKIRASMRQRMLNSPLCDAKSFTRSLEDAYRKMWKKWCSDYDRSKYKQGSML